MPIFLYNFNNLLLVKIFLTAKKFCECVTRCWTFLLDGIAATASLLFRVDLSLKLARIRINRRQVLASF